MTHTDHDQPLSLCDVLLNAAEVAALFRDLQVCVQIEHIALRPAWEQAAPSTITLEIAQDMLNSQRAKAVQIRYAFQAARWIDTLTLTPMGVRLVRVRHDCAE